MTKQTETFELIWGADAIAKEIGKSPRAVFHMLEKGMITPARKKCGRWVVERGALVRFFLEDAA